MTSDQTASKGGGGPEIIKANKSQEVRVKNFQEQQLQQETTAYYKDCLNFLGSIFDNFQQGGALWYSKIYERVKEMKTRLQSGRRYLLSPPAEAEGINYNLSHSVNTALLALNLAETLKLSPHRQIEVGIAALLHPHWHLSSSAKTLHG